MPWYQAPIEVASGFSITSFDHIYAGEVAVDTTQFEELKNALLAED